MKKLLVLLALLVFVEASWAQPCPIYPVRDRALIKNLFSVSASAPPIEAVGGVQAILTRMNEIAVMGSLPYWRLPAQRQAFEMEYQAWLGSLDQISLTPPPQLSLLGKRFVRATVNSIYLGVNGTTVQGDTEAQAIANAQAANGALTQALSRLWRCF